MPNEQPPDIVFEPRSGLQISNVEEPGGEKSYRGLRLRTKSAAGWIVQKGPKKRKKGKGKKKPAKKKAPAKKRKK